MGWNLGSVYYIWSYNQTTGFIKSSLEWNSIKILYLKVKSEIKQEIVETVTGTDPIYLDKEKQEISQYWKNKKHRKCEFCNKDFFSDGSALKKHIDVVHKGIKKHKCEYCEKTFGHSNTLKLHLQRKHQGEGFPTSKGMHWFYALKINF